MIVKILGEYECWPTWVMEADSSADNLDPHDLPLSTELADALDAWDDTFQAIYNRRVPQDSTFASEQEEERWLAHGEELSRRLY